MDGDEVGVRGQYALHGVAVTRADHLDVESQAPIRGSGRMLAEAGTDDRILHERLHDENNPVSPVPPTLWVNSSRVADRPRGRRRSGWL